MGVKLVVDEFERFDDDLGELGRGVGHAAGAVVQERGHFPGFEMSARLGLCASAGLVERGLDVEQVWVVGREICEFVHGARGSALG